MYYLDMGQGEPLVFIHGLGSKKESWKYQFELSQKYRLIIPDLRGHGESNVTENISIETFAEDVLKLLDSLSIEKAHFCGLSMGGIVTQEIYKQQPNRVLTMILSNTLSYSSRYLTNWGFMEQIEVMYKISREDFTFHAAKKCLLKKTPEQIDEVKVDFLIKRDVYIGSSISALKSNYLPMLPFVKVPTLIIGSLYDEVVPIAAVQQTKLFLPRAELYIFKDAGHVSNYEQKEKYNEILSSFLEKHKKRV